MHFFYGSLGISHLLEDDKSKARRIPGHPHFQDGTPLRESVLDLPFAAVSRQVCDVNTSVRIRAVATIAVSRILSRLP